MRWSNRKHQPSKETSRWVVAFLGVILALALVPSSALAHSGPPPVPENLWSTWNLDPVVLLVLSIGLWAYIRGVRTIWSRAGRNSGVRYGQVAAGIGGFLLLAIALVSPLDPLSSALFSAHMGQHVLLISIAPLLFLLGNVSTAAVWALPHAWRRKIPGLWQGAGRFQSLWELIARPIPALLLHSLVLWAWHVPMFYDAAVRNEFIHGIEHVSMFTTAMLFWWMVIQRGRQPGLNYGIGLLLVFALVIQKTALGALITFSPDPWYAEYASTTLAWGLTPSEDQELAGAVLMGPGGMVYLIAGVALFAGWIRAIERRVDRDERLASAGLTHGHEPNQGAKETA